MQKARCRPRPTSASFHGASTEVCVCLNSQCLLPPRLAVIISTIKLTTGFRMLQVRKIRSCRSGGSRGTSNRRPSSGDHRSGVEPHYSHSWDEHEWNNGRMSSGGSAWGGSVVGRFESRLGFSALASSDMPLTKENGDLRPMSRSSATSISSIETFVNEHGVDVRNSSTNVGRITNEYKRRGSSAGRVRSSQVSQSTAEALPRRPASAGWSGGHGPVSSVEESTSLASLANFVENAVDVSLNLNVHGVAECWIRYGTFVSNPKHLLA